MQNGRIFGDIAETHLILLFFLLKVADFSSLFIYFFLSLCTFTAKPHWLQTVTNSALSIEENLAWECKASGRPKPSYSWLKNGEMLAAEVRTSNSNHVA